MACHFLRNLKKGVDKWGRVWYSNQAVREMRGAADRSLKKFKKLLTDARERDTIKKLLSTATDR